jgi:hypothetical protein
MDPSSEDYAKVMAELEEVEVAIEEAAEATQSGQVNTNNNSLIQQNTQDSNEVINAPVEDDIDLSGTETTPLGEQIESSPTPEPTASPTP